MGRPRPLQICCASRCLREILPTEKAVALTCFAQTMGMGKRRTSKSERLYLCPQCAYRVAGVEKEPSKTAPFDLAIYKVLLDLVGADPDVAQAGWEQLQKRRKEILYQPALTEGEILPPQKRLKEVNLKEAS
jgi:hypothetical protein